MFTQRIKKHNEYLDDNVHYGMISYFTSHFTCKFHLRDGKYSLSHCVTLLHENEEQISFVLPKCHTIFVLSLTELIWITLDFYTTFPNSSRASLAKCLVHMLFTSY